MDPLPRVNGTKIIDVTFINKKYCHPVYDIIKYFLLC